MSIDEQPERDETDFIFICPSNLECVLAAGDESDIPAIREWCADLPRKSYGRVFIEVDSPQQIESLTAPPGVGVTWVERKPGAMHGAALMGAVDAWLDEWLRGDPLSGRDLRLWPGALDTPAVAASWMRIEAELTEMSTAAADYRNRV